MDVRDHVLGLAKARRLAATGEGRAIRVAAELSLADIASPIGVSSATIYRWETGARQPRGDAAVAWAALLDALVAR